MDKAHIYTCEKAESYPVCMESKEVIERFAHLPLFFTVQIL